MSSTPRRTRRCKLVVDQAQRVLVLQIVRDWVTMLFVTLLLTGIWQVVTHGPFGSFLELAQSTSARFAPVFVCLLCVIPIVARRTMRISNRATGPLLRISLAMRSFMSGKTVAPIKLRDGDFGQELAADFNQLLQFVDAKTATAETPKPNEPAPSSETLEAPSSETLEKSDVAEYEEATSLSC